LSPKFRTHSKNVISSEEGLEIFRKWQTHNTPLWFISLEMSDFVPNGEAWITAVSPISVEMTGEGRSTTFDPRDFDFWRLDAEDIPLRETDLARYVRFLGMRRRSDDVFLLLAELATVH
jgi:hypothetical protein